MLELFVYEDRKIPTRFRSAILVCLRPEISMFLYWRYGDTPGDQLLARANPAAVYGGPEWGRSPTGHLVGPIPVGLDPAAAGSSAGPRRRMWASDQAVRPGRELAVPL